MKVFSYIIVAACLVSTILAESYAAPPEIHYANRPPLIAPAPDAPASAPAGAPASAPASTKVPKVLPKLAPTPSITYETYKERCKNLSPEQKKKHDTFAYFAHKHCLEVRLKLKSYIKSLSESKEATVRSGDVAERLKKLLSCNHGQAGKGGEHKPYGKSGGKPPGKSGDAKPAPGAEGDVKPAPDSGHTKPASSAPAGDAKPAPSGGDTKPAPTTGNGY